MPCPCTLGVGWQEEIGPRTAKCWKIAGQQLFSISYKHNTRYQSYASILCLRFMPQNQMASVHIGHRDTPPSLFSRSRFNSLFSRFYLVPAGFPLFLCLHFMPRNRMASVHIGQRDTPLLSFLGASSILCFPDFPDFLKDACICKKTCWFRSHKFGRIMPDLDSPQKDAPTPTPTPHGAAAIKLIAASADYTRARG